MWNAKKFSNFTLIQKHIMRLFDVTKSLLNFHARLTVQGVHAQIKRASGASVNLLPIIWLAHWHTLSAYKTAVPALDFHQGTTMSKHIFWVLTLAVLVIRATPLSGKYIQHLFKSIFAILFSDVKILTSH